MQLKQRFTSNKATAAWVKVIALEHPVAKLSITRVANVNTTYITCHKNKHAARYHNLCIYEKYKHDEYTGENSNEICIT